MAMNFGMKMLGVLILSGLCLQGCSVGMAMSGKKQPELGAVRVGATRGEIELHLGSPVEITEVNGKRVDIYEYEIGNEPSAGRAIGHGVMDVLTLGLWEVVGSPIEGFQGEKKRLMVTYNEDDTVDTIGTAYVKKETTEEKTEKDEEQK